MSETRNYITPAGAKRLQKELQELNAERSKVVEVVSWAAGNGDRSENGDYIYGKRRLREIDKRVRFLIKRLEIAEIVDPEKQSGDRVLFGATVRIENEDGEEKVYAIVGADETNPKTGHISWLSPIGQALLQKKAGDEVRVRTPGGVSEVMVLEIAYRKLG
jgi:transcription elongation factor GreB